MALAVAIQMDPIETINIDGDSTFALALEAQKREHSRLSTASTKALTSSFGLIEPWLSPVHMARV